MSIKRILIRGPILTSSGYGVHARTMYTVLWPNDPDLFKLYVVPVNWGQTGWISEDTQERKDLDKIIAETQIAINNKEHFDISLQVTIPNEWERLAPVNIGITAGIETTKVAPEWLQKANEMDKIITISEHSKKVFEDTVYTGQHPETGETVSSKFKYSYRGCGISSKRA